MIPRQPSVDDHPDSVLHRPDRMEESPGSDGNRRRSGEGQLRFGGTIIFLLVSLALIGPIISGHHYDEQDLRPDAQFQKPSAVHWLGTDDLGRDLFTRIAMGARVSLTVGLGVVAIELVLGMALGLLAGYHGGRIDSFLMRLTDVMFAFPDLLLAILIAAVLTVHTASPLMNILSIYAALGIVAWPGMARLVRGQAISLREREFVDAARVVGASDWRIMTRHIAPNLMAPVIVALATSTAGVILAEATLSFLGIGIQPPFPSWGSMISAGMTSFRSHPELTLMPAVALASAVLGFNFLSDGLRDRLDPRMRGA